MKKKILLLTALLLCYTMVSTGCGTTGGGSGAKNSSAEYSYGSANDSADSGASDPSEASESDIQTDGSENSDKKSDDSDSGTGDSTGDTAPKINKDMLIYTCDLKIDTLDYESSVSTFKTMLDSVGGFVEKENYSDGQSSDSYYVEESKKSKRYRATVRVPKDKYEDFLNGAPQLGDIRTKSSNVENVSQEYNDLNTSLKIYEAKEQRYIKMLADIKDDNQAVTIEKELTQLQIQIAQLKTRMNTIQTDVDYSTINITIREVSKYEEEPAKTDTFGQRLSTTIKSSWSHFLTFLEVMLFLFIKLCPYMLLFVLLLLCIHLIQVKRGKRGLFSTKRRQAESAPSTSNHMYQFTDNNAPAPEVDNNAAETDDSTEADDDNAETDISTEADNTEKETKDSEQ